MNARLLLRRTMSSTTSASTSASSVQAVKTTPSPTQLALAEQACAYLTASTDPYHAVSNAVAKLTAHGFAPLDARAPFDASTVKIGGKYYYTVHDSTLVAFCVGTHYQVGNGFHILGGHTDSPNLRVKPLSAKPPKSGVVQLGVECYGGGLWHTWFDRDLSLSGKVLVRTANAAATDAEAVDPSATPKLKSELVQLHDPVARVSTLCIHLQSADERLAFKVNKEDHTAPIIAMQPQPPPSQAPQSTPQQQHLQDEAAVQLNEWQQGQEPLLLQRIANELNLPEVAQIADFDLSLYDTQPAAIGGMNQEFLYSGRLDNLATVFCGVEALIQHSNPRNLESNANVAMLVCFDHEEVGSVSSHGAGSPVVQSAIQRVSNALGAQSLDDHATIAANSMVLSVDQAHAVHPNYASKHESQHSPQLNHGIVVKTNSNQRYATNSLTSFCVRELARLAHVPLQEFCVRNDCPCGSTIGPTISALTGIRTVDLGMPQLSMHSCREVMGTVDLSHGVQLFTTFFGQFREVNDSLP